MKRVHFSLSLAFLFLAATLPCGLSFAQTGSCEQQEASLLRELEQRSDTLIVRRTPEVAPLFFQLNDRIEADNDRLEVEVLLDGVSYLEERIVLTEAPAADESASLVELLAPHGAQLAHLLRLSHQEPIPELVVRLNGNEVTRAPLPERVTASAPLT